jgi:hypothetical protein
MLSFTIRPVLGLKNDVPPDSSEMFEFITESIAKAHCVESRYIGYSNIYVNQADCANKTGSKTLILSSDIPFYPIGSGTLYIDNFINWHQEGGGIEYYIMATSDRSVEQRIVFFNDVSLSLTVLSDGSSNETFIASTNFSTPYCQFIPLHDKVIATAGPVGQTGPWCIDPYYYSAVKLIKSGATDYSFFYMEEFTNRLFGAYTTAGQGGSYDIRYSNLNPTYPIVGSTASTVEFADDNQIFNVDLKTVTGLKKIRNDRLAVYSDDLISEITYNANFYSPYSIKRNIGGFGTLCNDSIVEVAGTHFFYDPNNGFCVYDGIVAKIISNGIRDIFESVKPLTIGSSTWLIYSVKGVHLPITNEVAWSVSYDGLENDAILYYNYITGNWRTEPYEADSIASGYKSSSDKYKVLLLSYAGAEQGSVYYNGYNASNNGAAYDAYRIEPVLNFGGMRKSLILGIWFNHARYLSSGTINVYYRGGNTLGQTTSASWTLMGIMHAANADYNIVRPLSGVNVNNRYHQIKWGSSGTSDLFSVREIKFDYVLQGMY